jgi:hypothetical protein
VADVASDDQRAVTTLRPCPARASLSPGIAGEALPPDFARIAEGVFGEALAKAVEYEQHSVLPTKESSTPDGCIPE